MEETNNPSITIEEIALEERKFLHELSNILVVAHGMGTFLQYSLSENPECNPKDLEKINKVMDSMNKINRIVKERRAALHTFTVK